MRIRGTTLGAPHKSAGDLIHVKDTVRILGREWMRDRCGRGASLSQWTRAQIDVRERKSARKHRDGARTDAQSPDAPIEPLGLSFLLI